MNNNSQKQKLEKAVINKNPKEQIKYFENNQFTCKEYEKSSRIIYGD